MLCLAALLLSGCAQNARSSSAYEPNTAAPAIPEGIGINIHFTDPQPGEMKMLAAAGFRWVRMDFYTPLEVNASGRPVIAYRAGGALETVVNGVTGIFFDKATADSLVQAIEEFETRSWDPVALRRHAEKFDRVVFAARFIEFLKSVAPAFHLQTATLGYGEKRITLDEVIGSARA